MLATLPGVLFEALPRLNYHEQSARPARETQEWHQDWKGHEGSIRAGSSDLWGSSASELRASAALVMHAWNLVMLLSGQQGEPQHWQRVEKPFAFPHVWREETLPTKEGDSSGSFLGSDVGGLPGPPSGFLFPHLPV